MQHDWRMEFHIFVAVVGPGPPPSRDNSAACAEYYLAARIVAGLSCEYYLVSNVVILSYLATAKDMRGRGLARRLCTQSLETLGDASSLFVLEAHARGVPDPIMPSATRLRVYDRLGFLSLAEFPFAMPALVEGLKSLDTFLLLVHKMSFVSHSGQDAADIAVAAASAAAAPAGLLSIPCARLLVFVLEYYAATYTAKSEWDNLLCMLRYCLTHKQSPCTPIRLALRP